MNPRWYQDDARRKLMAALATNDSALCSLFTGGGKTNVIAWLVEEFCKNPGSRALLLAHRRELIDQMARRVRLLTGFDVEIEMGKLRAREDGFHRAKVVIGTVQSLLSDRRRRKFRTGFDLVITDEAHHATSRSYVRVTEPFLKGGAKHVGFTATPDRADKIALGNVFDVCPFDMTMRDGIEDGWLVPVRQRFVEVKGLDYSSVSKTAGDLNQKQVGEILEFEETMHRMVWPTIETAAGRKTIIFAVRVHQAERIAEIINRWKPGSAASVSGKTPEAERDDIFRRFRDGDIRFLVNVGVATEGFDDPGIEVVALMRPLLSRALVEQMIGRGTRPLPGTVDGPPTADARKKAIAASAKPHLLVLDFLGNAGRHPLVHAADVLAGREMPKTVPDRTLSLSQVSTKDTPAPPDPGESEDRRLDIGDDVLEALAEAEREDRLEREERERREREALRVKARYELHDTDPFRANRSVTPRKIPRHHYYIRPSEKQLEVLRSRGHDVTNVNTMAQAGKLFDLPTPRQRQTLAAHGIVSDKLTFAEASHAIGQIKKGVKP